MKDNEWSSGKWSHVVWQIVITSSHWSISSYLHWITFSYPENGGNIVLENVGNVLLHDIPEDRGLEHRLLEDLKSRTFFHSLQRESATLLFFSETARYTYNNSVPASQKAHCAADTTRSWFVQFREIIVSHSENGQTHSRRNTPLRLSLQCK
jgi:hypothetical protein